VAEKQWKGMPPTNPLAFMLRETREMRNISSSQTFLPEMQGIENYQTFGPLP
jgi:hypothetical protein